MLYKLKTYSDVELDTQLEELIHAVNTIVLQAPNGTKYKIVVDNAGNLSTVVLAT